MDSSFPIRQLLELVPEAVFLKDEDGRYRYANEAAAEFLGLSVEEILGRTDRDLFPEEAAGSELAAASPPSRFPSPGAGSYLGGDRGSSPPDPDPPGACRPKRSDSGWTASARP